LNQVREVRAAVRSEKLANQVRLRRTWFGESPSAASPTVGRQMAMCQICRRSLLAGERYRTWRWSRRDQTVCVVCEPEAREAGAVRVVDAFESVRVSGLTQNVRRVA
jgi:hypothetical protein